MVTIEKLLEESRRELLDLSARNRLLSMPVESKSARVIHVHDEKSNQIFRLLVGERKTMSFLPGIEKKGSTISVEAKGPLLDDIDEDEAGLPQPDDESDVATGEARRHVDTKLQTALASDSLQRRLLAIHHDAQLIMEEQGVNILYLALGRLKWFEAERADTPRYAPLLLVPVQLHRRSARERFTVTWQEEEVQENLSLVEKLKAEFGIDLPKFPTEEELVPSKYAEAVARAVAGQKRWEVQLDAMTLGFFSFAKFLMYRDLDPCHWPDPEKLLGPTLSGLLRDGFPAADAPFSADVNVDELIPAARLDHVVDADSSQSLAIEMVRQGRSVVVQGPPGTGKSQSIANIIATAILDGKKVLFVAEKLAALQVVKRRLDALKLGDLCLELHSHKANKRAVMDDIGRTWQLGRPQGQELEQVVPRLDQSRSKLNGHAAMLHTGMGAAGVSPFRALGALASFGERGHELGELDFVDASTWDAEALRERRSIISGFTHHITQMGAPSEHPWRGAERQTVLNIDLPKIREKLERLAFTLSELCVETRRVCELMRQPNPEDFAHVEALRRMTAHVAAAPTLDSTALCDSVWQAGLEGLEELIEHGREFKRLQQRLIGRITEAAYETDFSNPRIAIAAHGQSFFRFLNGDYRRSITALRGFARGELPKSYDERVELLDKLITARKHLLALREAAETGRQAFGDAWRNEESDWEQLAAIVKWVSGESEACIVPDFRKTFCELDRRENFANRSAALCEKLGEAWSAAVAVKDEVELNLMTAFGFETLESVPLVELVKRVDHWRERLEALTDWSTWFGRAARGRSLDLGIIVNAIERGSLPPSSASDVFERSYYSRLIREAVHARPELAQFNGVQHEQVIEEFQRIDLERLKLAKYRVLAKHYDGLPARHAGTGATGILLAELERKRGHRPVRKLLKDAGSVVQSIKPVFMMSPLSVAQYLAPGAVEFDLLVVDEASQVQPVDALGAFARAKQHVVVGDSKQLPPTRFFSRLTSSDESETDIREDYMPAAQAKDVESILGLCCARGMPETMLRWHYRSRHHSLIAVSNHEFYEDKLFIVPSPYLAASGLGLSYHFIEGGTYDRGQSSTNRVEARAVCRAIMEHARDHAELSLGIAAFSIKQQQAILDELELLRREDSNVEDFFHAHPHEPFFVKNLENVQGDERDVIFISVGYGPDVSGYFAMNFGPLSSEGGERRLNVLISRAKQRCEVFASLHGDDIDLARVTGRGVRAFKTFLKFAETGRLAVAERTVGEEDSPFEEAVRRAVEGLGYEVHPQVGVAGFFVDLGVVDPAKPGRYIIGIECDGAAYHSARSARDRDRLRQAVLEDHGWTIHRIWSTDWFQRPGEQLRKVAAALERAKTILAETAAAKTQAKETDFEIEREVEEEEAETLAVPYVEARFDVPSDVQPHELATKQMADALYSIVQIEGPIHEDELTTRIRDLWGLGRAGSRIQDSVARGIRSLLISQRCQREDDCLFLPNAPVPVRNREVVNSSSLRKPNLLPPQELRAAIEKVVDAHYGAGAREIVNAVSRLLGFHATSGALRECINTQIEALQTAGRLVENDGLLRLNAIS